MYDVLIVDDDFMVARAHHRIVAQTPGFSVVGVAHSGEQALDQIETLQPHLVLLDMYLPDMSGLEVIRRVRERRTDLDFLVLSAADDVAVVNAALHGGVVSYLLKPFKVAELTGRLVAYAERRRLLNRSAALNQSDLDQALGAHTTGVAPLPKGLSRETAALIERLMGDSAGDLAASECGEQLGLSRVVARRYLEYFVDIGVAKVTLRYGHAGRPQRRYDLVTKTQGD